MSYAHVNVAIIGAGIAGLAAARRATEVGLSYVVLEAMDRLGGRIHTAVRTDGLRWDTGAHWLRQPPVNKLIAEANRLGIAYDREWRPLSRAWQEGEWLSERAADEVMHQIDDAEELADDLVRMGEDATFLELLDPAYAHLPLAEAMLAFEHAAWPRQASTIDHKRYGPFDGDWAVRAGFGTLVEAVFETVDVELGTAVRVIDWGSDPIRVDFSPGLIEADRVLATVSTAALAGDRIHFAPELPEATRAALGALPLGAQEKVSFLVDPAKLDLEPGSTLHTAADEAPIAFYRPLDGELVVAILSGPAVQKLTEVGDQLLIEAALERFGRVFGTSGKATARDPEATAWGSDPYIGGAASAALPSCADARQVLRDGIEGRLYFAGEATSLASFGTAHGAYASGIEAIDGIAESLGFEVEQTWNVGMFGAPAG